MATDNKRKLYDALSQDYDMGSYEQFCADLNDEGKRRKLYDATSQDYDLGTWDSFSQQLGYGQAAAPVPERPAAPVETPAPTAISEPVQQQSEPQRAVAPQSESPAATKFNAGDTFTWEGKNYRLDGFREDGTARVYLDGDLTEQKMTVEQLNEAQPFTAWTPTWQQRAAMQQRVDHSTGQFQATAEAGQRRLQNIIDYNGSTAGINGRPMKGKMVLNPATGKIEQTYITPYGDETTNQHAAEMAAREFRAERFAVTLPGRIQATLNHIADLKRRINKRASESLDEAQKFNEEKLDGPLGILVHPHMIEASQQSDPELETLRLALSNAEKQLQQYLNVKDQQQNGNGFWRGYWRGTGQAIANVSAWDFGFTDLRHAMNTKFLADKIERGDELTESEQIALHDLALTNAVMSEFDLGLGYRWGDITGTSLSYMKDFWATGAFSGLSGITTRGTSAVVSRLAPKWAAKTATRFAEREVLSRIAQRGFLQFAKNEGMAGVGALLKEQSLPWAVKALGTTADDLLVRAPMMANTVQGMSTMAKIINNKAGNATYNPETDQFTFEDGTTWSNAVWQVEADQAIENFSEMWGAHLPGLTDVTKAFGARKLTAAILRSTREGAGTVISKASKFLKRAGANGYFGEVGEEYYGQVWRTMLGLDSAYDANGQNLFKSGQFHGDIWGGMALSVGLTGGGAMAVNSGLKYGGKAVDYYMIRNAVNRSDRRASTTLTAEVWEPMRTIIDATDNANIGALAEQVWNDRSMTDAQKTAVLNYMEAAMVMRGHNLREFVTQQSEEEHEGRAAMADAYIEGINIESAEDRNRARMSLNYEAEQLRSVLNVAEDTNIDRLLAAMYGTDDINALVTSLYNDEAVSEKERTAIVDYLKASNRYNGMMQAVNDQIEADIAEHEEFVDSNSDKSDTGNPLLRAATLKLDDERVFIIGGNVQMLPDGTMVDIANSDKAIFIRRMDGSLDTIDAADILNISQPESTAAAKQRVADYIRNSRMAEFMDQINGTVAAMPGDIVTVQVGADIAEAQVVQNDGINVAVAMPDGSQTIVPLAQIQDLASQQAEAAYRAEIEASKTTVQPSEDLTDDETASDESGLSLPRDKGLFPDEYDAPYSGQRLTASRYIENGAFKGMEYVNPITGTSDVIIAAVDDNSYVGYFREYDNNGNPTNEWSAKFENHSGDRSVHAGLMQTAAHMLPPGHELTEHTSVSTDGLRNLANQLRHGYTIQTNPDGTVKGRWVTINAASRNNGLGVDYAEREFENVHITDEQYDTAKRNLAPLMLELGMDPDAAIRMVSQPDGQKTIQVYHPTLLNTRGAEESAATTETTATDDVSNFTTSTEFALNDNLVFGEGTDSRLVGAHARIVGIDNSDPVEPQYVVEYTTPNGNTRVMYKTAEDLTALQASVAPQRRQEQDDPQLAEDGFIPVDPSLLPADPLAPETVPNPTENAVSSQSEAAEPMTKAEESSQESIYLYERQRKDGSIIKTRAVSSTPDKDGLVTTTFIGDWYDGEGNRMERASSLHRTLTIPVDDLVIEDGSEDLIWSTGKEPFKAIKIVTTPDGFVAAYDKEGVKYWLKRNPITGEDAKIPSFVKEHQSALQRLPKDEKGNPIFEQAENADHGWDALVEFRKGDTKKAQSIADAMVEEAKKAHENAQRLKPKGKTVMEMSDSQDKIEAQQAQAQRNYDYWQRVASVQSNREAEILSQQETASRQRAIERAEAEKAEREAREEQARMEREALEGIPEWHMDTPENARARGSRRFSGQLFMRQEPVQGVPGKEVEVKFSQDDLPKGRVAVIEAGQLQPSHIQGHRNPMFFIEEAQPKNRAEAVSTYAAKQIAEGIRPEEITGGTTAYTGAPTVNARGEVIQGNNRSDALRYLWENDLPQQQTAYKQYLLDNAEQLGLDPEAVNAMQQPVLVNMLDVNDSEAIRLGQMTAQDTESGGIERIKPKNVAQKLGDDMRQFANMLLRSGDEEATFGQLVDRNGTDVMKWMNQVGAISNTQYQSAFDSKGNLTAEAKNDLQKVLYQAVFKGGSQQLEEMFDRLPAKAQRAILATAFRDMDSPFAGKMLPEIQASIVAYNELISDPAFAEAKKLEGALRALQAFKATTALDDRLEQYSPSDNFSNFALHLAAMYKAGDYSQGRIAALFNEMYDLAQGRKEATLFEDSDTTEYPLADVIKKVLNIDYKPAKNGNNNVANGGADVALRNQGGQGGELRGKEPPASGEQTPAGTEPSDRGAGVEDDSAAAGGRRNVQPTDERKDNLHSSETGKLDNDRLTQRRERIRAVLGLKYSLSDEQANNGELFYMNSEGGTELARISDEIFDRIGVDPVPFKLTETMGWHVYNNHAKELGLANMDDAIDSILDIINNVDHVRLGRDNSYIFSVENGRGRIGKRAVTIVVNSETGEFMGIRTSGYDRIKNLKERPLLWQRGADSATEAVATPTVTTIKAQQGDEHVGRTEGQSKGERSKPVSANSSDIETDPEGKRNGTATPQSEPYSEGKDNNSLTEEQISGEESSLQLTDDKDAGLEQPSVQAAVEAASAEVDTNPTEAQKEAGNYKKGHVTIGDFDITIENPAGSVRKGVDANGKPWETKMTNAYGYILNTESADGDHIDVFLAEDMDWWDARRVFVIDQTKEDGSFDGTTVRDSRYS